MPEYEITVVRRAALVLRALAQSGPLGVSELSRELGIGKASVFRLLHTLTQDGLVRQDVSTSRYGLGPELVVLGQAAAEGLDLSAHARPRMERLSQETGLPSYLNVAGALDVVCLKHVPSMAGINLYGEAGHTMPYHACPSGLVLLAFGPPERVEQVIERGLKRYGSQTITEPKLLLEALAAARAAGFASGADDLEDGVSSIAAPITDAAGCVVASLGLAGFSHLFTKRFELLVAAVREAASEISFSSRDGIPVLEQAGSSTDGGGR
ncbi:MAG: IclR family transcriptional regulator [Gaiellaceae bacterium]